MARIPGINHLNAVRALEKAGFRIIRQGVVNWCQFSFPPEVANRSRVSEPKPQRTLRARVARAEA